MFFCDPINDDDEPIETSVDLNPNEGRVPDPVVVAAEAGRTVRPRHITPRRARRRRHAHRVRAPPDDDDDDVDIDAYSVAEFCRRHGISQSFFFQLQAEGRGPKVMRVGRRTLISRESAKTWRGMMEKRTAAKVAE